MHPFDGYNPERFEVRCERINMNQASKSASLLVFAFLLLAERGFSQQAAPEGASLPHFNGAPSFFVRAEANHASRIYREGDSLKITAVSEVDGYGYVIYHQADGKSFQIFPNSHQPDNTLKARQPVSIPAETDLFRWRVTGPFGKERITVFCTREPLEGLSVPGLKSDRLNPVNKEQLKGVQLELGRREPSAWGMDEIELTTSPRSEAAEIRNTKRVGVFFGVAQYQFNLEAESARGQGLNLSTCHRDARQLAGVFKEVGQLSDTRVLTNEQATRANLEWALTTWLPAVTQPGDTVIVYFSGHGMKTDDDNGDEADGKDESLIPHDYLAYDLLQEAVKRYRAGTLEPANQQRVAEGLEIAQRAASEDQARIALVRHTAVSDDLFAHWLQRLAGRQVIVVLDICFAGGFATEEKDLLAPGKPVEFDFVHRELSRLKDLGQENLALLSSSSTSTTSAVRVENDLSVMTFHLIEALQAGDASVTIESAHQHCQRAMKDYFARTKLTPHEPQLFNYSTKPVLLRP